MVKKPSSQITNLTMLRKIQRSIKRRPRRIYEVAFFLSAVVVILLCLSIVFRHPGWPLNHEGLTFVNRANIYAEHFRQGDLFPVWSSADAFGFGTPLPLYYHKLFYYPAGLLLLIFGSAKLATWLTIALFMALGAYGMRASAHKLTKSRMLACFAALTFLLTNYVFLNWLVRGAMAEFSAMMIVPWALWWCLNLILEKRFSFWIIPIFYLLFQAHNITALYSLILFGLAMVFYLAQSNWKPSGEVVKKIIISAVALLTLIAPQLYLQYVFLKDYNPSKITQRGFLATENFLPLNQYISNQYRWLLNWQQVNVRLDVFIWITVIAGFIKAAIQVFRQNNITKTLRSTIRIRPEVFFLSLSLALYMILQLEGAKFIYTTLEPLQFLQFPWRLLTYITPLSILLCVIVLQGVRRRSRAVCALLCVVVTTGTLLVSPLTMRFNYAFIPSDEIMDKLSVHQDGYQDELLGIGEYLPTLKDSSDKEFATDQVVGRYKYLANNKQDLNNCTFEQLPRSSVEDLTIKFSVSCKIASKLYLPISYSRMARVTDQDGVVLQTQRDPGDPRLVVLMSENSKTSIVVMLPRIF